MLPLAASKTVDGDCRPYSRLWMSENILCVRQKQAAIKMQRNSCLERSFLTRALFSIGHTFFFFTFKGNNSPADPNDLPLSIN